MIASQPLKWHGGKSYLAKWIHSLAPKDYTHRNIVYMGGGGEFWNWLPVEGVSEAVNDLDAELTNFYNVLANPEWFDQFKVLVEMSPFSEVAWKKANAILAQVRAHKNFKLFPEWRAANFFVNYRMSRQGLGKDYATPTTRTRRGMNENVSAWLSAVDGLTDCHERLRRVEIRNMDALEFIRVYDHKKALFYCDPPYLHETRSTTGEYTHEMSHGEHADLLRALCKLKGKFMLSGYPSRLYDGWAQTGDWTRHEKQIDNKASSSKTKQQKTECLWTNY
jgi:DNA adenine methylase